MDLEFRYNQVCNEYVNEFCEKQELLFEGWVGSQIGGVAVCSDMFFNFNDLVWDVNSKQKKGLIIDWYYEVLDKNPKYINYHSYSKGLRFSDLDGQPLR